MHTDLDPLARTVRLLALATSGSWCSVSLYRRGRGVDESECLSEPLGERQSQHVLRMVDELCTGAALDLSQLDAIAFDAGPGSFTGLRIGCAVAQGLGYALGRPLVPVDSLQALAWQCVRTRAHHDATVLVANDARMGELYVAAYRVHEAPDAGTEPGNEVFSPPRVEPLLEPCLFDREHFVERIRERVRRIAPAIEPAGMLLAGDAWLRLRLDREWSAAGSGAPGPRAPGENDAYVHADALAEIAHAQWCAGRVVDAAAAAPRYLRDKVALDRYEQQALRAQREDRGRS